MVGGGGEVSIELIVRESDKSPGRLHPGCGHTNQDLARYHRTSLAQATGDILPPALMMPRWDLGPNSGFGILGSRH